jgi:hypothetical protein
MRKKAKGPFDKYKNWIGMGLVLVVFVVVLLVVGKPAQPKSKQTAEKTTSKQTVAKVSRGKKPKLSMEERLSEKAQKKLERARLREERMKGRSAGNRRVPRSERASRVTRITGGSQVETGYVLKGIFVDEKGEKYALIGDRRARHGDVVVGRKIQDIETDRVKVEYGSSTYEVRVGNKLF